MAITIDSGGTTRSSAGANPVEFSVNAGSGTNRLLVVAILQRSLSLATINSVTYNGVSLTQAVTLSDTSGSYDLEAYIYYLANPASGSNTLSISCSATLTGEVQCAVFNGAAQTSPLDQTNSASGTSGTPGVSVTPTENNELVFGAIVHESPDALSTGSGETTLYNQDRGAWVASSSYDIQTTAEAQNVDYSGTSDLYVEVVATFKQAASGGTAVTPTSSTCIAKTTSPTPILGNVAVTPAIAAAIAQTTSPTPILGSVAVTPAIAATIASIIAATAMLGSTTATPATASAITRSLVGSVLDGYTHEADELANAALFLRRRRIHKRRR